MSETGTELPGKPVLESKNWPRIVEGQLVTRLGKDGQEGAYFYRRLTAELVHLVLSGTVTVDVNGTMTEPSPKTSKR